jgi:hypothetical protein
MEYRYFLDLAIDDELPHFTKVGCFRARLGEETFAELFEMFVSNLKELGIITKDEVRYMDATWGAKSKDYQFLGYKHNVTATETGFIEVISTHQGHKGDESFLYNKKDQYKKEMRKRGSLIEGIFGCTKNKNHLRRAKYRGITKEKF